VVAGDLEVPVQVEVRQRVPEPHDVRVLRCSEFQNRRTFIQNAVPKLN
jgi:hypothetical protein